MSRFLILLYSNSQGEKVFVMPSHQSLWLWRSLSSFSLVHTISSLNYDPQIFSIGQTLNENNFPSHQRTKYVHQEARAFSSIYIILYENILYLWNGKTIFEIYFQYVFIHFSTNLHIQFNVIYLNFIILWCGEKGESWLTRVSSSCTLGSWWVQLA